MNLFALTQILLKFDRARILCVGDVMLDHFVYGRVSRISPEAPIPILRCEKKTTMLGGAGNVVRNLNTLGARCRFIGVVGDDDAGQEVARLFASMDKTTAICLVEEDRRTTIKSRYTSGGHQLLRVDEEDTYDITQSTQNAVLRAFENALPDADAVILSDYSKGVLTPSLAQSLILATKDAGKIIVVDPKSVDYSHYGGADFITPNASELHLATKLPVQDDTQVVQATLRVLERHEIGGVLATRGSKGMTLHVAGDAPLHLPTQALEVFDVSGAGDTVIAVFTASLAAGATPEQAARLANLSAGLVVAKVGTATLTQEEISLSLEVLPQSHHAPTLSRQEAQDRTVQWHREGLKVGFTNGCFDILHPGHVSLLRQAKEKCDRLIVGLNSDASVKRLNKGDDRPINHQGARAELLSALQDVDLVVIFDEDTPLSLIQYLRPDVLIKGADYTIETVVGAREVLSWGGDVVLATLTPNCSTTQTISKLKCNA